MNAPLAFIKEIPGVLRLARQGNGRCRMAVLLGLYCVIGIGVIFWMFSVYGCNNRGHMGQGGLVYRGPDRVCLHQLDYPMDKPFWGQTGANHIEIGTDPDCLLNLEVPKNWECWLEGPNEKYHFQMMDQVGNLIMKLPQPLCRPRTVPSNQVGESTPYPIPLETRIPASLGGTQQSIPPELRKLLASPSEKATPMPSAAAPAHKRRHRHS